MNSPITPETTLSALLESYPGLGDSLESWVPALARVKNPVLRESVARATTLEQAARLGGVPVRDLVARVREAAGQGCEPAEAPGANGVSADAVPDWIREDRVRVRIDADSMLATGEHPVGLVRSSVAQLAPGELVRMTVSFRPAPLIDMMRRNGATVHTVELAPGRYAVYFMAAPA